MTLMTHLSPFPLALGAGYYLCAHTMYFYLRGVEIIFSSPRSKKYGDSGLLGCEGCWMLLNDDFLHA